MKMRRRRMHKRWKKQRDVESKEKREDGVEDEVEQERLMEKIDVIIKSKQ
jgi:hypothetical protein